MKKKSVMLMVPLLDQGGLERICAITAKLLNDKCKLCLVVFCTKNMFYDVSDVELIDLQLGSKPGIAAKCLNVWRRVLAVKKIKREREIQITYSFGSTANLVNVLSRVRDSVWVGIRGYGALSDKRGMKLLSRRADKVICCAKVMADDVQREFAPHEVECLYNPCDLQKIEELEKEEVQESHRVFFSEKRKLLVSMSRADDVKGFWHQIKALALIRKEIPEAGLLIVGDGDFSDYEKLAENMGVREAVLFAGLQKNPYCYLKKGDLYLLTSATEGFPNSMVEAMAMGIPVLSVNCKTGPAEILLENYKQAADQHKMYQGTYGVLLPLMNPVKNLDASVIEEEERILAREAIRLLQNPVELKRLGEAAKKRSRDFSISRYVEQLMCDINQ